MKQSQIFWLVIFIFCLASFVPAQVYDRAKMWDAEINALTEIDKKQTPPEKAVLFVGSSSIRLWANLRESFPNLKFINRGFGGSHLQDTNYYFDQIVTPYHPKMIVIYAGENDVNDGAAPEKAADDYRKFANLVRQKLGNTKIIYISLKPSPSRWKLAGEFKQTNNLIKAEIVKDKNAVFIDVWSAMLNENGEPRPELFREDMLHMKENGYAIWRGILEKYLK